jgi:hypothetical protein
VDNVGKFYFYFVFLQCMNNGNDKVNDMNNLCVCVFFFHFLVVWP